MFPLACFYPDLLPEFMGLTLFFEVVVQAHVDETPNVCGCLHVHYFRYRCRVITRVRVEGRDHRGLGLRSRGEGIGHESEALHKKRMNMTLR